MTHSLPHSLVRLFLISREPDYTRRAVKRYFGRGLPTPGSLKIFSITFRCAVDRG